MTTPVMPAQTVIIQTRSQALIKDAFHVFFSVIVSFICRTVKETSWWHLARITRNDHLFTTGHCANSIPGRYL